MLNGNLIERNQINMMRQFKILTAAALITIGFSQPMMAEAGLFKKLGQKLDKKKKKKAAEKKAPKVKPFDKTPTGFGKGDELVISIDKIMGGTCKRGGGATAYKLTVSAVLWSQDKNGAERVGPVEVYSEDIAPLNPKQTMASDTEIRIPVEQINAAFDDLGYGRYVADKAEVIGSTLGIGIDPVGPCSKLGGTAYRGYNFVTPSVFLDFPNPYHKSLGAGAQLVTQKAMSVSVIDNDAARLGDAQGSATKTMATISVGIEDHE
jgi:hypothetical protein